MNGITGTMGKRLPKTELLKEIAQERQRLDALLSQLAPRQMARAGVTQAGWSVKDILGHLIGWQQLNLEWYAAGERGESPEVPAPGLTWKDVRELNDRIYRRHHRRSLKSVLADFERFHSRMLQLISDVSEQDLIAVGRYGWAGPTWSLSDYIRANTASHYRWACKHLRKWLRTQKRGSEPTMVRSIEGDDKASARRRQRRRGNDE